MIPGRRPHLWLALALVVVLIAAAALWLLGIQPDSGGRSALSTPATSAVSPLPTPTPTPASATTHPPPWATGGAVLLWVTLGIVLALGITFVILRWHRHDAGYRSDTGYRPDTE